MQAQTFVLDDPTAQDVGVQVMFDSHRRQGDGWVHALGDQIGLELRGIGTAPTAWLADRFLVHTCPRYLSGHVCSIGCSNGSRCVHRTDTLFLRDALLTLACALTSVSTMPRQLRSSKLRRGS